MFNLGMLLDTAPAAGAGTEASPLGNIGTTAIMIVILVAVFYLFMIRPENKKKKKLKEMRDSLSVGDDITTIGGIIGKVVACNSETVTFETGEDRVRVQVAKWAISTVGKATEEPGK
jgi:preprotein translocase subunit YajC